MNMSLILLTGMRWYIWILSIKHPIRYHLSYQSVIKILNSFAYSSRNILERLEFIFADGYYLHLKLSEIDFSSPLFYITSP